MTIEEMRAKKQEIGYSYAQISELSGVPLGTVQKIFSGETTSPRYDTLQALEQLFTRRNMVREEPAYSAHKQGSYTVDDYRALPEEKRVELIDGYFYDMSAPTFLHQRIGGEVYRQIANFIMEHEGDCQPLIAPVDIQLDCDEKTMVQPDVAILCADGKIRWWGVFGAPDFILEIISPSTKRKDYTKKLTKYMAAGVREYWILDPYQKKLLVYFFESEECPVIYGLDQPVPIGIYQGELEIQFEHIARWVEDVGVFHE
ncbi:MAG: Uma2 family endonuclease [Clostridiales bacterium]|nr:Uma2 family endonuclease [Clostridiales bacterium]